MVHSGCAESGGVDWADGRSQVGRAQGGEAVSQAPAETQHLARPTWKQRACGVNGGEGLSAPEFLPPVLLGGCCLCCSEGRPA